MALLGLWMRWPVLFYDGPATQDAFNDFSFDRFASYSDIASLYFRDALASHPAPYFDYAFEYPVGIGLTVYLLGFAATLPAYVIVSWLLMLCCALAICFLIPAFPNGEPILFALSPAVAFYVLLNWDMLGILLAVAALLLFQRERDSLGAVLLAATVWTKFFPIVFLPFILLDRLKRRGWSALARILLVFGASSVAVNAPVLLAEPEGWWRFFEFNSERDGDFNLGTLFLGMEPSSSWLNPLSLAATALGTGVILGFQWKAQAPAWLPACCGALAWFFLCGKVYSPQYALWVLALLAVVGASTSLAVAFAAQDALYFAASFATLGLLQYGDATGWFVGNVLEPAAMVRELLLLLVVAWCVRRIMSAGGESPRNSPQKPTAAQPSV